MDRKGKDMSLQFSTKNNAPRVAKFDKISFEQFKKDWLAEKTELGVEELEKLYNEISLPKRATAGSAGYDFYSTEDFTLAPGETIKILTGIRAEMLPEWALLIYPRSGLGFKYRLQLNNTVGVIDSDYFFAKNEGHIQIKITNDSNEGKSVEIKRGTAFAQGIFTPYGITVDDTTEAERTGGLGSTGM